jgi:hypothetical protein
MSTERVNDLQAFKGFVDEQLVSGGPGLTVDEVLARWDHENQSEPERAATLEAIREGLNAMRSGRTRPFADFDRAFRDRRGISPGR